MKARNFSALEGVTYDVLIIGGGIHGLATAYAAAGRGLKVALVDKGDFGASTSFNHQRTAHGGLRALQTGRLGHARESILERRALALMAPRLLRPLPFMVGTYRSIIRSRPALRAAFQVDRYLGRHRNDGVEPELHLPAAKLTSRAATVKLFRGIRPEGLTGGANWYDYQIVHANRLTIAFAEGAEARGATLVNYAAAVAPLKNGGRVGGMRVRDVLSGGEIDVAAKLTLNAAGAHAGDIMNLFGLSRGHVEIATDAGVKDLELLEVAKGRYTFRAAMGQPENVEKRTLPVDGVDMEVVTLRVGNPQCVVLGEVSQERLHSIAAKLAVHPAFPAGSNVELATVEAPDRVRILIWERGVGPTEASGTGACASAVAAIAYGGANRDVQVTSPGGTQRVEWTDQGIFLTGWAELIAEATTV